MTPRALAVCLALATGIQLAGQPRPDAWRVAFTDVGARAGLVHPGIYGGVDRKRFIIETNGCGTAFVDYDNDGWIDALVLSGTRLAAGSRVDSRDERDRAPSRLYRNRHDGTFADVTAQAGLGKIGWASSVCAGDYDNDGFIDLFVTYFGANVLYHNLGGRFEAAPFQAHAVGARWAVIVGDQELAERQAGVRDLRAAEQRSVPLDALAEE